MQNDDPRYVKFCKVENLRLAWNRILTSTSNLSYKDYYRRVFNLHQINIDGKTRCFVKPSKRTYIQTI